MSRSALIALVCVGFAFAASAVISRATFDRLPHLEDEFAYLYQARLFAGGDLAVPTPHPRAAYWQPFLIDVNGQRFGKYPPGWPLILAVGVRAGAPWIVNAWLAALAVALVYRLGRDLYSPRAGAVAALLAAASPMALLLSGTLMGHTAGMGCATLFLYALWKLESPPGIREEKGSPQRAQRIKKKREEVSCFFRFFSAFSASSAVKLSFWAVVAGLALGALLINRPLTAAGIAAPLIAYEIGRALWTWRRGGWRAGARVGTRLGIVAVAALGIGLIWPWFNWAVSAPRGESFPAYLGRFLRGDDDTNLYLRVWPYDRVGFGPQHGRAEGGHTLALGWEHARRDMRCAARDVFGWAAPLPDDVHADNACTAGAGWSYASVIPLGLGLLAGWWRRWTWLLLSVPVSLTAVYMAYWAGSWLYGARYYAEALAAVAVLAGGGIAALFGDGSRGGPGVWPYAPTKRQRSIILYAALGALAAYSLAIYTPARLAPLRGYGSVAQAQIDRLNARREDPSRPLLVIAVGDHHWREVAALMALTTPRRDGDIVLARDVYGSQAGAIRAQFPDREVIYYASGAFTHTPPE